jgi:hypothetical protein
VLRRLTLNWWGRIREVYWALRAWKRDAEEGEWNSASMGYMVHAVGTQEQALICANLLYSTRFPYNQITLRILSVLEEGA